MILLCIYICALFACAFACAWLCGCVMLCQCRAHTTLAVCKLVFEKRMNEQTMFHMHLDFKSTMLGCSASLYTECVSVFLVLMSVVCGVASSAGGGDYQCCLASFGSLHTWNKRTETVSRVSKIKMFTNFFFVQFENKDGKN